MVQIKKPARGKLSGKGPFSRTENKWPTISRKNLLVKVSANFITSVSILRKEY